MESTIHLHFLAADVGIAISEGAEIAREIADITISEENLYQLVTLKAISNGLMSVSMEITVLLLDLLRTDPFRRCRCDRTCHVCAAAQHIYFRHQLKEHDKPVK